MPPRFVAENRPPKNILSAPNVKPPDWAGKSLQVHARDETASLYTREF
jgi:hypothetical protein